jgi:hypothetical protein
MSPESPHVSQSASQASAFYLDVARSGAIWTLRDAGGYPAPKNRNGVRAQPFWSSRSRAETIVATIPAYTGFRGGRGQFGQLPRQVAAVARSGWPPDRSQLERTTRDRVRHRRGLDQDCTRLCAGAPLFGEQLATLAQPRVLPSSTSLQSSSPSPSDAVYERRRRASASTSTGTLRPCRTRAYTFAPRAARDRLRYRSEPRPNPARSIPR